jgi:hypothetical protein
LGGTYCVSLPGVKNNLSKKLAKAGCELSRPPTSVIPHLAYSSTLKMKAKCWAVFELYIVTTQNTVFGSNLYIHKVYVDGFLIYTVYCNCAQLYNVLV